MSVKVGDKVFVGPGRVSWVSEDTPDTCHPSVDLSYYGVTVKQDEIHPWHPALPAVARLLVETPDLGEALSWVSSIARAYQGEAYLAHDDMPDIDAACEAVEALIAALEPEATPANAEASWVPGGAYRPEIAPGLEAAKAALEPEVGR